MKTLFSIFILAGCSILSSFGQTESQTTASPGTKIRPYAYAQMHIAPVQGIKPSLVKVAVVDDGFRLSHKAIKPFIRDNEKEVPGNLLDDDQNGYVDDVSGFDVSDGDGDVSIPADKVDSYYHGTYIAGIISGVFTEIYGEDAQKHLQIIPVKAIADNAKRTYISDGYKGIDYAITAGADIICCAWSGGFITPEERAILNKAFAKGIIIVGSAGNFYTEKADSPSDQPGVFCVAALDSAGKKLKMSNYHMKVDISTPGERVFGAFPLADNSFTVSDGTSPAAALAAGLLAALKAAQPEAGRQEIIDALKNTAIPLDSANLRYCGKLGAGLPNVQKAFAFLLKQESKPSFFNASRPEGKVWFSKKTPQLSWNIHAAGAYKGINLKTNNRDIKGNIKLFSNDSLRFSGTLSQLLKGHYVAGSRFRIELERKSLSKSLQELDYALETIDSTTLFCAETIALTRETDSVTDGSLEANYANNCSCKWQITVPEGKKIRIDFEDIDTEANVDFIWIFEGKETLQENLIAKFSGQNKPPVIISYTNNILLWFVTDERQTGKGWKMSYQTVDQSVPSGLEKK